MKAISMLSHVISTRDKSEDFNAQPEPNKCEINKFLMFFSLFLLF